MFTRQQAAQVKQLVIKHTGKFATEEQLQKLYEADYKGYLESKHLHKCETYAEYFGDLFEDPYCEEAFLCAVEEVL